MKVNFTLLFFIKLLLVYSQDARVATNVTDVTVQEPTAIQWGGALPLDVTTAQNLDAVSWAITDADGAVSATGKGRTIADYHFDKPGKYKVSFSLNLAASAKHTDERQCNHFSMPAGFEVLVAPYKIEFLFDEMRFRNPLVGDKDQKGNTLYLPVLLSSYGDKPFVFSQNMMQAAGVEAHLTGHLDKGKTKLAPGKQVLEYQLQGELKSGSYIMVDFFDAAGNIQSAPIKEMIK